MNGMDDFDGARMVQDTWAALILIDDDCAVRLFNPAAERITGVEAADALGRHVCDVLHLTSCLGTRETCPWARVLDGKERRLQPRETVLTIDDRRIDVLLGARPSRTADDGHGLLLTFVDMTFHRMREQTRSQLMANVFHELRTPLGSILMAAHFLSSDFERLPADRLHRLLDTIQHNASTLLAELNEMLNRSTFTTSAPTVIPRAIALDPLVDEAIRKIQPLLDKRGQKVRIGYAELPLVWADERRIEQILINLLTNANKYSVAGDEIVVSAEQQDNFLRLSIEDHGPGIAPEDRGRVFERLFRIGRTADTAMGSGLGLAIVRQIVETHGGAVGVEGSEPHGAQFWFTLPLAPATVAAHDDVPLHTYHDGVASSQ